MAVTSCSVLADDAKTMEPVKTSIMSKTTKAMPKNNDNEKMISVNPPVLQTQHSMPSGVIQKQPVKENKKNTINKKTRQNSLNYVPLKKETEERVPANAPQWSNHSTHDPGKTILKPQYKNEKAFKNTKSELTTISQPIPGKQTNRDYRLRTQPDNDASLQFGDGKTGSRPPAVKNTQVPVYRANTRSSTIDTTRGFNSQQNSTPQVDVKSTGKLVTTGFVRKPVSTVTSNTSGKQFSTKPRLITANRLIVKAHITNRRIRSQPLIVKGL